MNRPKTITAIVLDASGSMADTKAATVQGFNEQIQQAKANCADQDILCCLVTFNGAVFEHQWLVPASEMQEATVDDYVTLGSTAMRDAVGYTVTKLLETTDPTEEGLAYLIYIISDGVENASKHYTVEALAELVESVEKRPNFTITHLGCSAKYLQKVARETSTPVANMAAWDNSTEGAAVAGWQHSNRAIDQKFYKMRTRGLVKCANLQSDEVGLCADYSNQDQLVQPIQPNLADLVKESLANQEKNQPKAFNSNKPVQWKAQN